MNFSYWQKKLTGILWKKVRREVKEVRVDTTIEEKNFTFPTDRKLKEKVIENCKRIAKKE
jgi:hypothetical protein